MEKKSETSSKGTQGFGEENYDKVEQISKSLHSKSNPMIKTMAEKTEFQRSTTKMQSHAMEPITEEDKVQE